MRNLKFTAFLLPFFVFLNCATPVILKQNIKSKSKNLEIEVVKLTDGPDSFASGGRNFYPNSNALRLIHVTVNFKNLKAVDHEVEFAKIALEPTYGTVMDEKGKEIKKLNSPAFVRHFEVDPWNDVKEDVSGNNFVSGKVERKLTLKPNEVLTRTLIYFLPKDKMPEKLIFLDENATAISLK
ncbi:hypothetical protein EHQ68_09190 [Leptospira congkakensis]|uniref:DUF4352 domain-containing protein n=1 Tax=Leptospira congkakensis TaxID=2484932 RepID=A0A4Z1A546_9LEPT|nr:hypothetical protein [Leptospira congkakensis]TGL88799.1 hypothetical protein EHQ69_15260 [Leptospira congkakensis]TGL89385.1 hypothetical protein EHQ68_09190 [Leptospira congkakensis]TGL97353.1 hypothetical protein EHQ70_08685 [Leptospira congkakensis]